MESEFVPKAQMLIDKELENGKPGRILREDLDSVYETHAVWPQTLHLPLKVRLAVDILVSRLPAHQYSLT